MSKSGHSRLFPTYSRFPITLVKGEGSRLWDDQGKEYLDFASGLAVTNLGHVPQRVKERLTEQLDQLWHVSNLFSIPNQEKLAELLTDHSCADAAFFCNSGAEANEAAIKLARRYNHHVLGKDRFEIITFEKSFHGRTLATLTATGQDKVKEGFAPLPQGFVSVPYNDAETLRSSITGQTCAIMLELLQGEGGINRADDQFISEVVRICEEHDLLLIVDEIQTGIARTGKMFAYEHYEGLEPDIITLAKGLGSGFPIGAMLGKAKLTEAFTAGTHGTTFGGNPLATAAGIATMETIIDEDLVARAAELGRYAATKLSDQLQNNPLVKEVRGIGLLIGIECTRPVTDIIAAAHAEGLLVITAGAQVIRLAPNLLITQEDLDKGLDMICALIDQSAATSAGVL